MKLKKFFEKMQHHYAGYEYGTGAITVKFYANPLTFSYDIFVFENASLQDYTDSENVKYTSKVFYDWMDEKGRKEILDDIDEQLEIFEKKLKIGKD